MKQRLVLEFSKMNGAGNDFIVIDNRFYNFSSDELSALARRLCVRRFSVGADGLLAFAYADDEDRHDYRMIYYNADGSRGSMCGNGARCLALFARDAGLDKSEFHFESDAGVYRARIGDAGDGLVRLFVQPPERFQRRIALSQALPEELSEASYIWPGVEHVVVFVDDVATAPVAEWGPELRRDGALGPAGANINFVQVVDEGIDGAEAELRARTFEKGVEQETLACGTGAVASALVARLTDRIRSTPVRVQMPGGLLRVGFSLTGGSPIDLYLEGPVETNYRGTLYV